MGRHLQLGEQEGAGRVREGRRIDQGYVLHEFGLRLPVAGPGRERQVEVLADCSDEGRRDSLLELVSWRVHSQQLLNL